MAKRLSFINIFLKNGSSIYSADKAIATHLDPILLKKFPYLTEMSKNVLKVNLLKPLLLCLLKVTSHQA